MWTENSVRAALPDVQVRIGKRTYPAQVSGRLHRFAWVTIRETGARFEYAWATIANALNNDRPLTV